MKNLTTAYKIRKALGNDYHCLVNSYDIKYRERYARRGERKQLQPKKCASCGRTPPAVCCLEVAHISPLSECAKTSKENLLLLCKKNPSDHESGCHTLYDEGYCSILDMYECRKRWIAGHLPVTRKHMMELRNDYGPGLQQKGLLRKGLCDLRSQQKSKPENSEAWNLLQIRIAELTRRPARKNALSRAQSEILKVDHESLRSDCQKARYFYEKAYIELLSGQINNAFTDFYKGRDILKQNINLPRNRWRWAAHTVLLAQCGCIMNFFQITDEWSWDMIRLNLTQALKHSQNAAKDLEKRIKKDISHNLKEEYRHARRWEHNCLVHLIKPYLAENDLRGAHKQWRKADRNWQRMDISNGWDTGFRATHLSLYGQLLLKSSQSKDDIGSALTYLVRSLVHLLGVRRQQPEGIRDLLFSIADALKCMNDSSYIHIQTIASKCVDCSSWFNPSYTEAILIDRVAPINKRVSSD